MSRCTVPIRSRPVSLLPSGDSIHVRRNPGTLPSRVADNFFWLGRYLERGEALLNVIRVMLGNSIDADAGAALGPETVGRLVGLVVNGGAAPHPASLRRTDLTMFARTAMEAAEGGWHSVRVINRLARGIGKGSRDRLAADMVKLLDAPYPDQGRHARSRRFAPAALCRAVGLVGRAYGADGGVALPRSRPPCRTRIGDGPRGARVRRCRTRRPTICRPCSTLPTARSAIASAI